MLFTSKAEDFESEKERNLYYKVFAGYFFNELVPGLEERLALFADLINSCQRRGQAAADQHVRFSATSAHVSFDNHAYLFPSLAQDKGEFADILLHDRANRVVVPIEAKVHSDWSYEKDVIDNERRLRAIQAQLPEIHFVPCLLITSSRWEECQRHGSQQHSNYRRFAEEASCRTRVLLWEDLAGLIREATVREHIVSQLQAPGGRPRYSFSEGWFKKAAPGTSPPAGA